MATPTRLLRILLLFILAVLGFILGYARWTYVIIWLDGFELIHRGEISKYHSYPQNWDEFFSSLLTDPRWLSGAIYFILPFLLSISCIYLIFMKRSYIIKTIVVYGIIWFFLGALTLTTVLFSSYKVGIGLAQNIKHLVQTPFFSLFLVSGFKIMERISGKE